MQKSKKLLSDALVSLILEKGYEEVTIQDILDRANIGRSTFTRTSETMLLLPLFGHEHLRNLGSEGGFDRSTSCLSTAIRPTTLAGSKAVFRGRR